MGWYFRKSVSFGPFRMNIGSRGVGYSVGGKGFRVGVNSRGRRYTSAGIPGTGWRYSGRGCLVMLLLYVGLTIACILGIK